MQLPSGFPLSQSVIYRLFLSLALGLLWVCQSPQVAWGQTDSSVIAQDWRDHIYPILEKSCIDCHDGPAAEASLDLTQYPTANDVMAHRRTWRKITTRVRDHQMPPADTVELSKVDREALLDWLEEKLPQLPCQHQNHAGAVTIRRLTQYEYINTVRDLLGVDFNFPVGFPADEVGYGFDNIGDVMSVSPLLLEKYLDAAEEISERVIFDPAKHQIDKSVDANELTKPRGSTVIRSTLLMSTNGTATVSIEAPAKAKYQLTLEALGTRGGDELPELALSVNGKVIKTYKVKATPKERSEEITIAVTLEEGSNQLGFTFTNDFYDPKHENPRLRDRNLGVRNIRVSGPLGVPKPSPVEQQFLFEIPNAQVSARECAQRIIKKHGSRAFRRHIYQGERKQLIELFDMGVENGESFQGAMQIVLQAMLVSPQFLFKVEAPAPEDGSMRSLTDFELATSLSYLLWSSMPDAELFQAAAAGELQSSPERLEREVSRMLADPKSQALIEDFALQWFQLRALQQSDPDPDLFPGYTNHLKDSMVRETQLLFSDVIQNDLPLTTLLTADYTFVNKALARHYGWSTKGLEERDFTRVSLTGKRRGGLLSHASLLTLTSNPTRTSPVKRGKWVLENLLAEPPPPALPDVPQLDSQLELSGSLRERMEQHRADPNCATCHYKMDSLGFALENFDAFGRFRQRDEGDLPIDSEGQLVNGDRFANVKELQTLIATKQRRQFVRCVVEKSFIYAIGRGLTESDECLIEDLARRAYKNDARFSDIIKAIVLSDAFRFRSRPVEPR